MLMMDQSNFIKPIWMIQLSKPMPRYFPKLFYNKEDQWEIPAIAQGDTAQTENETPTMNPRHMIMKLPGETTEEFILMLPFTPRAKDNLSAWMVARNDGQEYGKLVVYRFPKDKLIFGPKQVLGR